MILNKTGVNILLQKTFNSILQMNIQGTKIFQIYAEKKWIMLWKKIILKGNITTKYIEDKHKNTGTSVSIHPWNVEKQCH